MYDPTSRTPAQPFRHASEIICENVHAAVQDRLPEISDKIAAVASDIAGLLDEVHKIVGSEDETAARTLHLAYRSLQNAQEDLRHGARHVRGRKPQRPMR